MTLKGVTQDSRKGDDTPVCRGGRGDGKSNVRPPFWRDAVFALLIAALLGKLLALAPAIDLTVAGWFHEPNPTGASRFPFYDTWAGQGIRILVPLVTLVLALGLPLLLVAQAIRRWIEPGVRLLLPQKGVAWLILSLIVGPVLLVNEGLKAFSGRARPAHLDIFGRDKDFTPVFSWADQCVSNCSFVSGDVALATWFLAFLPLLPPGRRPVFTVAVLVAVVLVAASRIAHGAHFLSDVLFAFVVTVIALRLTWAAMVRLTGPLAAPHLRSQ